MREGEPTAILLTFMKQLFAIKTFILSIFEWPLKTCFTVVYAVCVSRSLLEWLLYFNCFAAVCG